MIDTGGNVYENYLNSDTYCDNDTDINWIGVSTPGFIPAIDISSGYILASAVGGGPPNTAYRWISSGNGNGSWVEAGLPNLPEGDTLVGIGAGADGAFGLVSNGGSIQWLKDPP
jgi:hypothetical protein